MMMMMIRSLMIASLVRGPRELGNTYSLKPNEMKFQNKTKKKSNEHRMGITYSLYRTLDSYIFQFVYIHNPDLIMDCTMKPVDEVLRPYIHTPSSNLQIA